MFEFSFIDFYMTWKGSGSTGSSKINAVETRCKKGSNGGTSVVLEVDLSF